MDADDFEGTIVLEQIAEIGKIDAFWEAIDADDFEKAKTLMKKAKIAFQPLFFGQLQLSRHDVLFN